MGEAPRKGIVGNLVVPMAVAALVLFLAGAFFGAFLQARDILTSGLIAAWAAYAIGRGLGHWDFPKKFGLAARQMLLGVALGLAGFAILHAMFVGGPGPWAIVAGVGFGLYRAHRPVLERAKGEPERGRLWDVFDRRELSALALLLAGYALQGLALHRIFLAFTGFIPESGKLLTIGIAIYALQGARLLLRFASHDTPGQSGTFVAWFKANLLRNAIVVLVLLAYAIYRNDLAHALPMWPLVEFGLGMAVFGFVVGRLRSRLKHDGTPTATASQARPHRQHVDLVSEGEYDAVARPLAHFIETGRGARAYREMLEATTRLADEEAPRVLAPLREHRETPPRPALPLVWDLLASGATTLLVGVGVLVLFLDQMRAPGPIATAIFLAVLGLGVYRTQDLARGHFRSGLAFALAAWGVAMLFLTFLLIAIEAGGLDEVPRAGWIITALAAGVALAIPGYLSWRQVRNLAEGKVVTSPRELPAREIELGLTKTRRRAGMMAGVAVGCLLLVPPLLRWAAGHGILPSGLPRFYADAMSIAIWLVAAVGVGALVRHVGYARARPLVLAEEKRKREARLALHHQVMTQLEKI